MTTCPPNKICCYAKTTYDLFYQNYAILAPFNCQQLLLPPPILYITLDDQIIDFYYIDLIGNVDPVTSIGYYFDIGAAQRLSGDCPDITANKVNNVLSISVTFTKINPSVNNGKIILGDQYNFNITTTSLTDPNITRFIIDATFLRNKNPGSISTNV